MLLLAGVDKAFPVRRTRIQALRDVTLTIPDGRLTAILGASGSGKTTLLRVIAGFERPDGGVVTLGERSLVKPGVFVRPERRGIGIVPQDGALFPHLDVAANVAFGLRHTVADRLSPRRRHTEAERVEELLGLVGLDGFQRRRVDQLSGGQQQRVALARALAPSPSVILLDEPFSAIDAALRASLSAEIRALLAGLGITTVLVTHDQEEALSLADQVVVMRDGRVIQTGTPHEVYEDPVDAATARFVGDAVVLDGTVVSCDGSGATVNCVLGPLTGRLRPHAPSEVTTLAHGGLGACQVIIRPEGLRMTQVPTTGSAARVVSTEYFGHDALTTLRLGADGTGPEVRVRSSDAGPLPCPHSRVLIEVAGRVLVVPAAAALAS
jgi:iron(III) transport system ATP-binding protein